MCIHLQPETAITAFIRISGKEFDTTILCDKLVFVFILLGDVKHNASTKDHGFTCLCSTFSHLHKCSRNRKRQSSTRICEGFVWLSKLVCLSA